MGCLFGHKWRYSGGEIQEDGTEVFQHGKIYLRQCGQCGKTEKVRL